MNWLHLAMEVQQAETALGMLAWAAREASSAEAKREAAEALPGAQERLRWALGEMIRAAQYRMDQVPLVEEEPLVDEDGSTVTEKVAGYQPEAWRSGV